MRKRRRVCDAGLSSWKSGRLGPFDDIHDGYAIRATGAGRGVVGDERLELGVVSCGDRCLIDGLVDAIDLERGAQEIQFDGGVFTEGPQDTARVAIEHVHVERGLAAVVEGQPEIGGVICIAIGQVFCAAGVDGLRFSANPEAIVNFVAQFSKRAAAEGPLGAERLAGGSRSPSVEVLADMALEAEETAVVLISDHLSNECEGREEPEIVAHRADGGRVRGDLGDFLRIGASGGEGFFSEDTLRGGSEGFKLNEPRRSRAGEDDEVWARLPRGVEREENLVDAVDGLV